LGQTRVDAHSALPDAPVQPQREGRKTDPNRRSQEPASPTETVEAAAPTDQPVAAGPNGSSQWDPCPCKQWGVCREDRHGCVARCKELFPQLDQELDAWEAEHGWLYR
ncbi:MAG TPA: hypothetical protein VGW74_05970, partial [Propionibacteriaceae bacterium]|nr:hypothetical protein [Propionibacteriaceae bacterium]